MKWLLAALVLALVAYGAWVIYPQKKISAPPRIYTFDKTGVLIYNEPGFIANTWFLRYEEPGKPAQNVQLVFDSESLCNVSVNDQPCRMSEDWNASHVRIQGYEGSVVRVGQLQKLN